MDTLFVNGRFYDSFDGAPPKSGMAVRDGKVLALGHMDELLALCHRPHIVDLEGGTVLPSFTDSHVHFLRFGLGLKELQLAGLSLSETLERVKETATKVNPDEWIQGRGFNFNDWPEGSPHKRWLDEVAPYNPVVLTAKDGHMIWVNSETLRRLGISANTPQPLGGVIERDTHGELTGVFKEDAIPLVASNLPKPTPTQCLEAIRDAIPVAYGYGITAVHTMEDELTWQAFQQLREESGFQFRVLMSIPVHNLDKALALGLRTGFGDEYLRVGGVKVFVDGSLGSRTALMLEPYCNSKDHGVSIISKEELGAVVCRANQGGIPIVIHAIGDRANRVALDAIEQFGNVALRNRIEHVQIVHPSDVPRFAKLNVIASMQPAQCPQDRYMADKHWGKRSAFCYPFRHLLDSGAMIAFGSDCPVESLDVLAGLYSSVARKRWDEPGSEPWCGSQAITIREALKSFTFGGAYAACEEGYRGTLCPGMKADFVVLSADIVSSDIEVLKETEILATYFEGNCVFRR